jgi:hypothetical protein
MQRCKRISNGLAGPGDPATGTDLEGAREQ